MFRVECTSCKAAYQVDERRVPAKGLTMKCPKCRESFLVSPPDKPAEPVPQAPAPAPINNFGGTMIGVSAKQMMAGVGGRADFNQTQIGLPGPRAPKGNDATMIGVAPSAPASTKAADEQEFSFDLPAVRGAEAKAPVGAPAVGTTATPGMPTSFSKTGRTQDLPVSTPPGPVSHAPNSHDTAAELPALKASRAPAAGPFATVASKRTSRINLSSLNQSSKPDAGKPEPTKLEAAKVELKKPEPFKAEPKPEAGPFASARGETQPSFQKVSPTRPNASAPTEAELPAVVTAKRGPIHTPNFDEGLDLPAVIGSSKGSGVPSGRPAADAPSSSRLHKPTTPELPAVKVAQAQSASGESSLFDLDLPAVFSDRGAKPSSSSGAALGGALGLPASTPVKANVSPSGAGALDQPDEVVDLDSEALESLAPSAPPKGATAKASAPRDEIDLPELSGVGLPEVAGLDLPDVLGGTALPAVPSQLDDAGLGFGELDLPTIGGDIAAASRPLSDRAAAVEFGSKLPSFAPSEPPSGSVSSQPPSFRARQDSFGDFDGVPSFAPSTAHPQVGKHGLDNDDELDGGLLDGESFSLGDERKSATEFGGEKKAVSQPPRSAALTRAAAQEYGQVNLDSGSGADDDEMEFGGIPQADSEPPKGVPMDGPRLDAGAPMEPVVGPAAPGREKPVKARAESRKKGSSARVLALSLGLLGVGGGALALKPEIGPFGIYAAQDLFLRGEHQALQTRLGQAVETARSLDGYAASVAAVSALDAGRSEAKRFVPLKAETAAQSLALALRFGGPPSLQSTGQVLINELVAAGAEPAEARRAQVVDRVLKGEPNVGSELASLPRNLFALTVEGEHWLRLENAERAITSWTEAVNQKRCAWTVFGLARAYLVGNQLDKAAQAIPQVLELNPEHVGAKLAQVDAAIRGGVYDPAALTTLQAVLGAPNLASPLELALAHTLRGEFDFGSGKTSTALEAFEEALRIAPGDVRGLTSSANALFASGRHAAALARFQAAVTAMPDAIGPRVGVIRAQLALEQIDQAMVQIQTLRQAHPHDIEVAYLSGAAALHSGETEIGRKVLEEAIALSKQAPSGRFALPAFQKVAVEAYVALATSFTKAGEPERATPILTQAAAELPGSAALRVAIGDVAFGQGQFDKALAEYEGARKLSTSDTSAVFKAGQTLSRLRRFDEAGIAFEAVAAIDPNYPGLPLERGLILAKSGKAAEALAEYEQALKHDPSDIDIQLRVGCGRAEAGQAKLAESLLKDVLVKRPRSAEANYCLGRAMFALGSNVEGLRLMRNAVEYDANSALYRLHLGWIASEMGQVAVARRELNRALELDQGSVDAYWQRGVLNLKQGAPKDATLDFKKALEYNPGHLGANADMAQALSQLGKEADSLPYWDKAVAGGTHNPVWLFRYGRILVGRNQGEKGTELLLEALKLVGGESPAPNWLWQAHYLVALGKAGSSSAVEHWRKYLELSPHDSPYRGEAKRALAKAGQPWEGQ